MLMNGNGMHENKVFNVNYTVFILPNNNNAFFIPIFLDYFLIYSVFFFKGPIHSSELLISINQCYSILLKQFITMLFSIQFVLFFLIVNEIHASIQ